MGIGRVISKVWINGKFFYSDKARVSIFDRGFMYGDGVFETMRSYAGLVFKLDEHLNRLFWCLNIIKIKLPFSRKYLKDAVYKSLRANKLSSSYIKITITRGEGRFGIGYKDLFFPNVVIAAKNFDGYPDWVFERGLSAKITGIQNEESVISKIKSLNYLPYILARLNAKDMGFDEAILTNTKGRITEAATSNIFLIKKDNIVTPSIDSGILHGITRGIIIRIAKKLGFHVKEKFISRRELLDADEVFLTNSLAEVLPVTKVDSKRISSGKVGAITKLLHISYQKQVIREVLR